MKVILGALLLAVVSTTGAAASECMSVTVTISGSLPVIARDIYATPKTALQAHDQPVIELPLTALNASDAVALVRFSRARSFGWIVDALVDLKSSTAGAFNGPLTQIDFDESGTQVAEQMFLFQLPSADTRAAASSITVLVKGLRMTKGPGELYISAVKSEPSNCIQYWRQVTLAEINGGVENELTRGVHNPPGGFMYEGSD